MPDNVDESLRLISVLDDRRKRAETKTLDVSLNELADMYKSTELRIRPEYQRLFRWAVEKQSRFIESLLLEMPIPPIYVIEQSEGKWELIDGLQRLSSYLHFRGLLDAPELDPPITPGTKLQLAECDIVTELNDKDYDTLPAALQIRLKRAFLNVQVIRKESDPRFRYYMFKRLNTGGEPLSDQELRNCTIRLLGDDFNNFIQRLSTNTAFKVCIDALSEDRRRQMVDVELVLRFLAFKNDFESFRHDISEFLTDYMEKVTEKKAVFDSAAEQRAFENTFHLLKQAFDTNACVRKTATGYAGGFSMHHFEAFSIGLGRCVPRIDISDAALVQRVVAKLNDLKADARLDDLTRGGGKNSPGPYRDKIHLVQSGVESVL